MNLIKYFLLVRIFVVLCFLAGNYETFSQCKLDHNVQLIHSDKDSNNGEIKLTVFAPSEKALLKLYIVFNSEITPVSEKQILSGSDKHVTFEGLKPGLYYLIAKKSDCEFSIGGIEGLIVKQLER